MFLMWWEYQDDKKERPSVAFGNDSRDETTCKLDHRGM